MAPSWLAWCGNVKKKRKNPDRHIWEKKNQGGGGVLPTIQEKKSQSGGPQETIFYLRLALSPNTKCWLILSGLSHWLELFDNVLL